MAFNMDADLRERQGDFRSQIDQSISGCYWNVAFFRANPMSEIGPGFTGAATGVPVTLIGIDGISRLALFVVITNAVEK